MTASNSLPKKNFLFFGVLLLAFVAFTADILDLREELHILSCPYSYLDSNVTTGLISDPPFNPEPVPVAVPVSKTASVKISFIHLLSFGFRAPPSPTETI